MAGSRVRGFRGRSVAILGLLIAVPYAIFLFRHASFSVGGSDSSGYANAARAIASGRLVTPIAPPEFPRFPPADGALFIPLGFVEVSGGTAMAPFYPPGFPLHIAGAALLAGWELAPFVVSPIAALLCLWLTYRVARALELTRSLALAAAALLAASPVFFFQAIQPLSDVPATLWSLAALLAAIRSRRRPAMAAAAGLAFGIAVLVRPGALILAPALLVEMWPDRRRLLLFALGGLPCAGAQIAYDIAAYGGPFRSGYSLIGHGRTLAWRHFPERARLYPLWLSQMLTPLPIIGYLAALADRSRPRRTRLLLACWFGAFFVFFCFYVVAGSWVDTRFLLPGLPALLLGFVLSLDRLQKAVALGGVVPARLAAPAAALLVLLPLVVGARGIRDRGVLTIRDGEASYSEGCRLAEARVPPRSLVISCWTSGALRYYTRLIPVRWDYLDPARFADVRRRTEPAGWRWYALLMKGEIPEASSHVPGRWTFLGERRQATLWALEPETPTGNPALRPAAMLRPPIARLPPGGAR